MIKKHHFQKVVAPIFVGGKTQDQNTLQTATSMSLTSIIGPCLEKWLLERQMEVMTAQRIGALSWRVAKWELGVGPFALLLGIGIYMQFRGIKRRRGRQYGSMNTTSSFFSHYT